MVRTTSATFLNEHSDMTNRDEVTSGCVLDQCFSYSVHLTLFHTHLHMACAQEMCSGDPLVKSVEYLMKVEKTTHYKQTT